MFQFVLIILAVLIVFTMAGYAFYLLVKLRQQQTAKQRLLQQTMQAKQARIASIVESIDVISRAMLSAQCDFSEGVLRLKPLCEVLGLGFSRYSAMYSLYQVVENMPILAERKSLKTNIRMKLDLIRETKEMELETQIKAECQQLLDDIKQLAIRLT